MSKIHDLTIKENYPIHHRFRVNRSKVFLFSNTRVRGGEWIMFPSGDMSLVENVLSKDKPANHIVERNNNVSAKTTFYCLEVREEGEQS